MLLYANHHRWWKKKILGFRKSEKTKKSQKLKFLAKHFLQYFQFFFHFNEKLPMKSYQFFKFYIRFYKKREKNTQTTVNENRKTEKIQTLFYLTDYPTTLKMAINHLFYSRSFCSQDFIYFTSSFTTQFLFFDQDEARNIKRGSWEQKLARNSKLQFLFQK